jgi:hypothetical protein
MEEQWPPTVFSSALRGRDFCLHAFLARGALTSLLGVNFKAALARNLFAEYKVFHSFDWT